MLPESPGGIRRGIPVYQKEVNSRKEDLKEKLQEFQDGIHVDVTVSEGSN